MKWQFTLAALATSLMLTGCSGSSSDDSNGESTPEDDNDISQDVGFPDHEGASMAGVAQKGPFRQGSTVTVWGLDEGEKTDSVQTETNNSGHFVLDEIPNTPDGVYWLEVEGEYFDEAEGNFSSSPLTLSGFVGEDQDLMTSNVNILSHATGKKLRDKLSNGEDFEQAYDDTMEAYEEAFGFNMPPHELDLMFNTEDPRLANEDLDEEQSLTHSSQAAAVLESMDLLVISAAASQEGQELIDELRDEFASNPEGEDFISTLETLGENISDALEQDGIEGDLSALVEHYQQRLLSNLTLPSGVDSFDADAVDNHASAALVIHNVSSCSPGFGQGTEDNPYRICPGRTTNVSLREGATYFVIKRGQPGAYRVTSDLADGGGTFQMTYRGINPDSSIDELCGSLISQGGHRGGCSLGTSVHDIPRHDHVDYVRFWNSGDPDRKVEMSATLLNSGAPTAPVTLNLEEEKHNGTAGSERYLGLPSTWSENISRNSVSFYRVNLSSSRDRKLVVDDFSTAAGRGAEVLIANAQDPQETIASFSETDETPASYEFQSGDGRSFLLAVHAQDVTTGVQEPTGAAQFYTLRIEDVD